MTSLIKTMSNVETEQAALDLNIAVIDILRVCERAMLAGKCKDAEEADTLALAVAAVLNIAIEIADRVDDGINELRLVAGRGRDVTEAAA